jgi:hypothetical protein
MVNSLHRYRAVLTKQFWAVGAYQLTGGAQCLITVITRAYGSSIYQPAASAEIYPQILQEKQVLKSCKMGQTSIQSATYIDNFVASFQLQFISQQHLF